MDYHLGALAEAVGRTGEAADRYRAAAAFARRLGAPAWVRLAERRLGAGNVFRRDDPVWRLRYAGREVLLPDGKGLHDLATLLAAPQREVPARDLLGLPEPAGGADPVLDAPARAAHRARLADLAAEADAAAADQDLARAERARAQARSTRRGRRRTNGRQRVGEAASPGSGDFGVSRRQPRCSRR